MSDRSVSEAYVDAIFLHSFCITCSLGDQSEISVAIILVSLWKSLESTRLLTALSPIPACKLKALFIRLYSLGTGCANGVSDAARQNGDLNFLVLPGLT
eukprot:g37424.t1